MTRFKYLKVKTIEEALTILDQYGDTAVLLAGGSDLLLGIRQGKIKPKAVIPLKGISDLTGVIERKTDGLHIGALATLSEIAASSEVQSAYQALAESAEKVGSNQIRNWATLAGNICYASPAANTSPALLVFNAEVKVIGRAGRRAIPITSFFQGPNKTALLQGEIVEEIYLPAPDQVSSSCYAKIGRREGADLAIVSVAVLVDKREARIGVGAASPTAYRAYQAEKVLQEGPWSEERLERAIREVSAAAKPITDIRATGEYRLAMVEVLTRRALETARKRLG